LWLRSQRSDGGYGGLDLVSLASCRFGQGSTATGWRRPGNSLTRRPGRYAMSGVRLAIRERWGVEVALKLIKERMARLRSSPMMMPAATGRP
jgi:hypothetical protein